MNPAQNVVHEACDPMHCTFDAMKAVGGCMDVAATGGGTACHKHTGCATLAQVYHIQLYGVWQVSHHYRL